MTLMRSTCCMGVGSHPAALTTGYGSDFVRPLACSPRFWRQKDRPRTVLRIVAKGCALAGGRLRVSVKRCMQSWWPSDVGTCRRPTRSTKALCCDAARTTQPQTHTNTSTHTHTYTRTARGYLRGVTAQMVLYAGEAQLAKGLPLFVQNSYGVKEDRMCRL